MKKTNMKWKTIVGLALIVGLAVSLAAAQQEAGAQKGIRFEHGLSWEQVKAKAKAENKYIFMDVYATWCGPCKRMSETIFPLEEIGKYINDNFVSVKVQTDKTEKDNDDIKHWYEDAAAIVEQYNVGGVPTFLVFNPEGTLVYRETGERSKEAFLQLARDASNTEKQYPTVLAKYQQGTKDYAALPSLVEMAKGWGDRENATAIARDYKTNYLDKLSAEELCTKKNVEFLGGWLQFVNSRDRFFDLAYHHAEKVDTAIKSKGAAARYVNAIVTREEIDEKVVRDGKPVTTNPDWKKVRATIERKYKGVDAKLLVVKYQIEYYKRTSLDWTQWAKYKDEEVKAYPPKPDGVLAVFMALNMPAWDAFLHCNDKSVLAKALRWSELSIKLDESNLDSLVQCLDTQANLLYKLGKVHDAIAAEQRAIEKENILKKKNGDETASSFPAVVAKMEKGEPTYFGSRGCVVREHLAKDS